MQGKTAARRYSRAGQGMTGQGMAGEGMAEEGMAGQCREGQGRAGHNRYTQPNMIEHYRSRLNACTQQVTCIHMGPSPNMHARLYCAAKYNIKPALVPIGSWQKRQCYCNKSCFG